MRTSPLRRLALGGGTLALVLGACPSGFAQDGQPPTGPPVTAPNTNKNAPVVRPPLGAELPPVPETASDPAPPGTRGVRVDLPKRGAPAVGGPGSRAGATGPQTPAGVMTAEGVVTRLDRAGKTINGELERFAFDPSQDWFSYVNQGAQGVPANDEERPKSNAEIKDANAKVDEAKAEDAPKVLEMVITKRTYVYSHARTADGTDHYGMTTAAAPGSASPRLSRDDRLATTSPDGPVPTNFTNIKEGSYVSVRYRKVGDLNEVLNLTLIERPLLPDRAGPGTAADGTTVPGPTGDRGAPGPATPATTTSTAIPGTPKAPGTVPSVPVNPVGPSLPQ